MPHWLFWVRDFIFAAVAHKIIALLKKSIFYFIDIMYKHIFLNIGVKYEICLLSSPRTQSPFKLTVLPKNINLVLPLGAWDGLRYFILALPEPSINYFD